MVDELFPTYNGILFFVTFRRHMISLYINTCLYSLDGFFFKGKGEWPAAIIHQANAFQAVVEGKILPPNRKMKKDLNNLSINVQKVEVILLAFQVWAPA